MEIRIACSLRNVLIDNFIPITVSHFTFNPPRETINTSFFTKYIIDQAGILTMSKFVNKSFITACITNTGYSDTLLKDTGQINISRLISFLNFSWFHSDNNFSLEHTFLFYDTMPIGFYMFNSGIISDSSGDFTSNFELYPAHLQHADDIYKKVLTFQDKKDNPKQSDNPLNFSNLYSSFNTAPYNNSNRIMRAISFLNMARTNDFLPLKISLYIVALESLFTTDNMEVTYKVSLRVAFYVGISVIEKETIMKTINTAYGIRSKFFHGQKLEKDALEHLKKVSKDTDQILRIVLNKVVLHDSLTFINGNNLNAYFSNLILNNPNKIG